MKTVAWQMHYFSNDVIVSCTRIQKINRNKTGRQNQQLNKRRHTSDEFTYLGRVINKDGKQTKT